MQEQHRFPQVGARPSLLPSTPAFLNCFRAMEQFLLKNSYSSNEGKVSFLDQLSERREF